MNGVVVWLIGVLSIPTKSPQPKPVVSGLNKGGPTVRNWVGTQNQFEKCSYIRPPIKAIRENVKYPRGLPRKYSIQIRASLQNAAAPSTLPRTRILEMGTPNRHPQHDEGGVKVESARGRNILRHLT